MSDAKRLEWVMRRLDGATLRGMVGPMGDTGDLETFRALIDDMIATLPCDRCGVRMYHLHRVTVTSKYRGCMVCVVCLEDLEPGRATPTTPIAPDARKD